MKKDVSFRLSSVPAYASIKAGSATQIPLNLKDNSNASLPFGFNRVSTIGHLDADSKISVMASGETPPVVEIKAGTYVLNVVLREASTDSLVFNSSF